MKIIVYELPQSTGKILYGARIGKYVVAHGFKTAKSALKAAQEKAKIMRKNPSLKQRRLYARRRKVVSAARDRVHDVAAAATLISAAHGSPNPRRHRRVARRNPLSRKNYVAIARIIKQAAEQGASVQQLAVMLMDYFKADNPRFDKARFAAAIGTPFHVQTSKNPGGPWNLHAAFTHNPVAANYARVLAKSNPSHYIRVFDAGAKGGPAGKKSNPVEPSRIANARRRFEDFSGMEATRLQKVPFPPNPKVGLAIGPILAVAYETIRDGKVERYKHDFSSHARPLLAASHDGRSLYLLGGAYRFTERGIVDRAK